MEKRRDERFTIIEETVKELPERAQAAIHWMITHFDIVEALCINSEMTNEEIRRYKEDARQKEDYIMLVLLCAAQVYNSSNETAAQQ